MPQLKKIIPLLLLAAISYFTVDQTDLLNSGKSSQDATRPTANSTAPDHGDRILQQAFNDRTSDLQVAGAGTVIAILPDDNDGSRHQRFLLRTGTGQKLLVAHNIDLAPRVASIRKGDLVEFYGEYEWNDKGGVIHWTHHDPKGYHPGGWIKHAGRTYE